MVRDLQRVPGGAAPGDLGKLRRLARAIFTPGPTQAEATWSGLTLAEAEAAAAVDLWPDHVTALNAFLRVITQWRVAGMGGVIGLDYGPLFSVLHAMRVPEDELETVLDQIRIMEDMAVKILNTPRK